MSGCFFVSDLHGHVDRYEKLFGRMVADRPGAVFLGGDLLPSGFQAAGDSVQWGGEFIRRFLGRRLRLIRDELRDEYPAIFVILGNDDPRIEEAAVQETEAEGLWRYAHNSRLSYGDYMVYGYSFVPPTPFRLKDWERYDVSRYVDPGCVSPESGGRSVPVSESEVRYSTIADDLEKLMGEDGAERAVFLFHSPPYQTKLDRAALDGKMIDHVPLDVHVGSIAIRRMIEGRSPLLTLHGHIHESASITGDWRDRIDRTHMFSAAHHGPELALVRFDLADLGSATRQLL